MQALPDLRQQSFEEIYGAPENFLEVEVSTQEPEQGWKGLMWAEG
jgi:hypothetical protein